MVITTVLAFFVATRWGWNPVWTALVAAASLLVDLTFFGANLIKVAEGGWYPLQLGAVIFALMSIWRRGRRLLAAQLQEEQGSVDEFIRRLETDPPVRVAGTAVFLTPSESRIPPVLRHHLRHNKALHEQVVLLCVESIDIPRIPAAERLRVVCLARGLHEVEARYGFMQSPDLPVALRLCEALGLLVDLEDTTFYLGRETLVVRKDFGLPLWQDRVFDFMARNAARADAFYHLPPERVVELGIQVEI
jgi:KUP system potassium uptake protein